MTGSNAEYAYVEVVARKLWQMVENPLAEGRAMAEHEAPADCALKVWWIPQVPMKAFEVPVPDIKTGALLCDVLAKYDLFQYENRVKPDYSNAGGLRVLDEDGDWVDFDPDDEDEVEYAESVLARRVTKECAATETPFFFKQVGGRTPTAGGDILDGEQIKEFPSVKPILPGTN